LGGGIEWFQYISLYKILLVNQKFCIFVEAFGKGYWIFWARFFKDRLIEFILMHSQYFGSQKYEKDKYMTVEP
jgi:hypothetical protein